MPMIFFLLVGTGVVAAISWVGSREYYNAGIPVVSSCGAAISAACHLPLAEAGAALKPLQWGFVPASEQDIGLRHCCFASGPVEPPEPGRAYA